MLYVAGNLVGALNVLPKRQRTQFVHEEQFIEPESTHHDKKCISQFVGKMTGQSEVCTGHQTSVYKPAVLVGSRAGGNARYEPLLTHCIAPEMGLCT